MKSSTQINLLFILFLAISFVAHAQKEKISGKIFSSDSNAIAQANIQLLDKNLQPIAFRLTDSTGNFSFKNIFAGTYILKVDAIGFSGTTRNVSVSKNKNFCDTIFMQPLYQELQSVVVTAKKPVVIIKTDTIEFVASAFKTEKNATVEDIFKKIPGVEVNKNGTIKAMGEVVTQIYVDGKPFFGNDLKAVTQNFPADVIDKIEIIDKKSDQALETKVDDGSFERIINITLKKNSKKGVFGKDYIGYGASNRYEAKANANLFNDDEKLSAIAGLNNTGSYDGSSTNNNNFSNAENRQVKISYANKIRNNFDFSAWTAYNENKNIVQQILNRQIFLPDSATNYVADNKNNNLSKNIYSGLYFEYKPDSFSVLRVNESVNYINNNYHFVSDFSTTTFDAYKISEGINENNGLSKISSINGQISYNRRLSNSGRNLFIHFSNFLNNGTVALYNNFNNFFFHADTSSQLKQLQLNDNRNVNMGTTISYSEPLTSHQMLNLSYIYNSDKNNMPEEVYDFNEQSEQYNLFNDSFSYHFTNNTNSNAVAINYNYTSKKIGFGAGMRWKQSVTESHSLEKDIISQQSFRGFLPNLSFYSAGKGKRLNIYYSSFIQSPQPYQLQPVIDNTNSMYVRLGNAGLKYAVVHLLKYNFKYYNNKKERGINSSASISGISNNIGTSVYYDNSTGKQIVTPVNTNGARNWNIWFSYFEPLYIGDDKVKWNINFSDGGFRINNLLNGEKNTHFNNYTSIALGITYDTRQWLNFHADVSMTKQNNKYSLQSALDNALYYAGINPVITVKPGKNTEINIDDDYRISTVNSTNFNSSLHILNVNITEYLNPEKNVWLTLKAFNLLNKTVNVTQIYGDNFIQNIKTSALSRYFLLTVNFRLNKIQK